MKIHLFALCMAAVAAVASGQESQGVAPQQAAQVVELVGGGYFFKPEKVTVKVNVPVEFRVKKEPGMVPHNFVIEAPEAGVQIDENLGEAPKTIRATFTKPGTYAFDCSKKLLFFESHSEKGMKGTIEVTQ